MSDSQSVETHQPRPLKPQKAALVILLLVFGAWMGCLTWLYLHQPRPAEHEDSTPAVLTRAAAQI